MKTNDPQSSLAANIMVVDDTPANLNLLKEMLGLRGYRVRVFPRGCLALAAAAQEPPDLILLDINMPEMNGIEVCTHLKEYPRLKDIPVLFLSALNETSDKVVAFAAGGVDYITKPFQFEEVEARVRTHLELHRLQQELAHHNANLEQLVSLRTRQLAEANARLLILDKAKSDFLHLISHELRTPLCGLFGVAELLFNECASTPLTVEYRDLFDQSRQRILTLFDDALMLTEIEVNGEVFAPKSSSLTSIVDAALINAAEFALSRTVSLDHSPMGLGLVLGDVNLLTKAMQSLLETAVKFSSAGTTVRLLLAPDSGGTGLLIEATGWAVPARTISRFFKVLSIEEAITPGGDFGLAAAKAERLLALFGGTVSVENLDPPGIRLRINLKGGATDEQ